MDAYELQEQMDEVRVRLLEAINPLPDEALTYPNAVDGQSIADLLAHLVNWEAEMVTGLMFIDQGRRPTRLLNALADRDAYNAARAGEMKGRDLDRIFEDLQGVRQKLEEWLEEFSQADLEQPGRYKWLKNKPLWKLIAETSYEHEAGHLPAIEAFSDRWLTEEAGNLVNLTDVEVSEDGNEYTNGTPE